MKWPMIREPETIYDGGEIQADICIVGAGVAGITFAREFVNTKLNVILLESGGLETNEEMQSLAAGQNTGETYYDLEATRARAFGGSSHFWHIPLPEEESGLRLRGLDKIDFEKRRWVPYSGWPFQKKELDPYYERAHKVFKIGPYRYDSDFWEDNENYPDPPLKAGDIETTIFQFGRKDIFYNDYWKELKDAGNIHICLNSTVLNVQLSENANTANSVLVSALDGNKFTVKAEVFVMALGGLETPRLMLLSNDVMKCGIGNQNDLVGRFFMEHPHIRSGIYYPSDHNFFNQASLYDIHSRYGIPVQGKIVLKEETVKKEELLNFTAALEYTPMTGLKESDKALSEIAGAVKKLKIPGNAGRYVRTIFKNLDLISYVALRKLVSGDKEKWYDTKYKYHGYKLGFMSEQIPDPESRVTLGQSRDRFGQNQIKLKWKLNTEDVRSIRRSQEIIDRELRRNKLGKLKIEMDDDSIPERVHGGKHHMGTTRMSSNPGQGVVDENCRIHGIRNLYVAGSSVFPTCGYANPTLTISALSLRLADHFKEHLFTQDNSKGLKIRLS